MFFAILLRSKSQIVSWRLRADFTSQALAARPVGLVILPSDSCSSGLGNLVRERGGTGAFHDDYP